MGTIIRSYQLGDAEQIQKIHDENKLDFKFPNLNSSLFTVNKVLEVEGVVRASYALRMVAEANLWLSTEAWTDPTGKWQAIKALDISAMEAARDIGIDSVQCFLPPAYKRFGKRICGVDGLGFVEDNSGWRGYGKFLSKA